MTLDEAIKHCEEVAYQKDMESGFETDNERYAMTDKERTACKECAEEHRQLAEWLKELKQFKEQEPCEDVISRAQALSDYADWYGCGYSYNTFYEHLKNMPSIQPKTDVLDKIRAEIDNARFIDKDTKTCKNALASGLEVALRIIDKYK